MPIPDWSTTNSSSSLATPDQIEQARRRLIVALDVPNAAAALDMIDRLEGSCHWFKVGLELFVAAGPSMIAPLAALGHSIFLDLKFNDIPNTVAGAVRSAATLGVRMITVHANGGPAMLASAQAALDGLPDPPQLLAVTVLTSMDESQVHATGVSRSPAEQAGLLARMALDTGIRGFVCSPQEAAAIRGLAGPEAAVVVPGIRPAGKEAEDQKRIATPAEALRAGASHLVVGRPITRATHPAGAAEAILKEMAQALH